MVTQTRPAGRHATPNRRRTRPVRETLRKIDFADGTCCYTPSGRRHQYLPERGALRIALWVILLLLLLQRLLP